jgi:integrase
MPSRSFGPGRLESVPQEGGRNRYRFHFTDAAGRRRRPWLGTNQNVAKRKAAQLIADREEVLVNGGRVAEDGLWADVLPEFLLDLELQGTASYVAAARRSCERVLGECKFRLLSDIDLATVQIWLRRRMASVAPGTANYDIKLTRRFIKWCVHRRLLLSDPLYGIQLVKHRVTRPARALTEQEIADLLAAADRLDIRALEHSQGIATISAGTKGAKWKPKGGRVPFPQALILRFLLKVGSRYGESRLLAWGAVNRDRGVIRFREATTKTDRERRFPIDTELGDLLGSLKEAAHSTTGQIPTVSSPVLLSPLGHQLSKDGTNFRTWFYRALAAAKIERINEAKEVLKVHGTRHTWATRMLGAGVPLMKVKELGGWKTTAVLEQIYAHIRAEDSRADVQAVPLPRATGERVGGTKLPLGRERAPPDEVTAARKLLEAMGFEVVRPPGFEPGTVRLEVEIPDPDRGAI